MAQKKLNELGIALKKIATATVMQIAELSESVIADQERQDKALTEEIKRAKDIEQKLQGDIDSSPELVIEDPSEEELIEQYAQILQQLYQALVDVKNAKADYVGSDGYVYRWDATSGKYQRTDFYVKGEPGTTDYNALENAPTTLSRFTDDLGKNPVHDHIKLANNISFNKTTNKIELKHGDAILSEIDLAVLIGDNSVEFVEDEPGTWPF